jgi:hypothetical protein
MQTVTTKQAIQNSEPIRLQKLATELHAYCATEGQHQGKMNRPENLIQFKATVLNSVETKIQEEINHNQSIYLPISGMVAATTIQKEAKEKIMPIQSLIKDIQHDQKMQEEIKKHCTPDLSKKRIRILTYWAAAIIAAFEGVWVWENVRIAGLGVLPSIATAIGVAIAIGFGTHYLARFIKHGNTKQHQIWRSVLVLIPAFIGFWLLGNMRSTAYETTNQMNLSLSHQGILQTAISGFTLSIFSFLLFLVGLVFSFFQARTKEEEGTDAQYDTACIQEKECQQKISTQQKIIDHIQNDANCKSTEALQNYEYALATESKLICLGKKAVEEFVTTNLRYRTDNQTPDFFANPPQLQYKTFFDHLKNDAQ